MEVRWQCEIDPYCRKVLAKHWPNIPCYEDVRTLPDDIEPVDLICGGYPCPAFSQAAHSRNTADDLWPYMRAVVAALRPRFVLFENVAAHLGRGFPAVLADLHALGFDAEWSVVTACSVGASHRRRRLFALAYSDRDRQPVFAVDAEVARMPSLSGIRGHWGIPTADDVGADDGVPARVDRLRGLGNAVVPQVAEWIGQRILAAA
jgi:DNA (cytosine-5)-methyltransferase 1